MLNEQLKILISDIDGTLSEKKNIISAKTLSCIDYVSKFTPYYFVLASGRPLVHIQTLIEKYSLPVEYVISSNGSTITSLYPAKKVLYKKNISKEGMIKFFKYITEKNLSVMWSEDNILHRNFDLEKFANFEYRHDPFIISSVLRKRPWPGSQTDKFMICMPEKSDAEINDITVLLQENFADFLTITTSGMKKVIEANANGVNKGRAVKFLLDYLKISFQNTVVAGDAMNDYEMFKLPVFSIAMGNADPVLKQIANFTTDECGKNGLAKAINKFIL